MYIIKCITCTDEEEDKDDPINYTWHGHTESQADMIRNIHLGNHELHKVEIMEDN